MWRILFLVEVGYGDHGDGGDVGLLDFHDCHSHLHSPVKKSSTPCMYKIFKHHKG